MPGYLALLRALLALDTPAELNQAEWLAFALRRDRLFTVPVIVRSWVLPLATVSAAMTARSVMLSAGHRSFVLRPPVLPVGARTFPTRAGT